jgi:hypothetical protein
MMSVVTRIRPSTQQRRLSSKPSNDFEVRFKTSLAEMEVEIAKLYEKGVALKDEAGVRWSEKMAELKAKQKVAREKLDEIGTSTGEAWVRMEKGAQSALDDLRKAFQEATKEF